ncbi:unnamed protein product [Rotaria sp. Silwood2]|nr:unnamed protein product [Rotaria sp. Silwood2]CAF3021390.1 unnamed protein product [Rotaria sp. Silwood2]CAF3293320.1 unnamed protein product [Rotaria sp. Silwood2]CAF3369339.1 unnamed protein product [Rotaria sp. Silwood2]CAF4202638.1 unnamed protein product [Rotaria sp. Silwood2]
MIDRAAAMSTNCNISDSLTLGLKPYVESADNKQAGIQNTELLQSLFAQSCFNGEFRFTRGKWPIDSLLFNSTHSNFVIRGSGAHLVQTGSGNFIRIRGVTTSMTNFLIKELILEGTSSGSVIYLAACQSSTIDSITTIGGTYGIFLEQALFDIRVRNSYVYGASEVGIFVGPSGPIQGANGTITNVEIFIDETRVHGCKTVSCCNINDGSCRRPEFAYRTLYGILIEGGNSGVYIARVSMAWTRRSGFAFNSGNQLMPSEWVFIRQSLVDSVRKYDDSDFPRGYEIESAADVSLSDNWAGSVEGDGVYINTLTRDANSFLKLTDFRIINCLGNAFYFTGNSLNTVVMVGNNMMSKNGNNGIGGNTSAIQLHKVSASIPG